MSRVTKYQNSIDKFIKTKSYINQLDIDTINLFNNLKYENIIPIFIIAMISSLNNKNNISISITNISINISIYQSISSI